MSFNPDPSKPAQEVIFSRKLRTVPHPSITFNNNPLSLYPAQKHLGLVLDSELMFNEHTKHILPKVNKSLGLLRKLQLFTPGLLAISFFVIDFLFSSMCRCVICSNRKQNKKQNKKTDLLLL